MSEEMDKQISPVLISAATNFSFSLLKECGSLDDKIFISPFSISTVLAMAVMGANGPSKSQMLKTLNMADVTDEDLLQFCHSLIKESLSTTTSCTLQVANGMFLQEEFEILEKYRTLLKECFLAEEKTMDFSIDESREYINKWVEKITNHKIKDLLASGTLNSLTRLVLVNAVYFKGLWTEPFEPNLTSKSSFHVSSSEIIEVDMMRKESDFKYLNYPELHCSCIELPYMGDNISMMIILPDKVDGLKDLVESMNYELLTKILKKPLRVQHNVVVCLPKFKITSSVKLENILTKMGMVDIFTDNADLSGITRNRGLKVSTIVHKSYIEVNEEGTEAAASTAMMIQLCSLVIPTHFVVDHPFMILIRNVKSGNILFMGAISKPC